MRGVLPAFLFITNVLENTAVSISQNDDCAICLEELHYCNNQSTINQIFDCIHNNRFHESCLAMHVIPKLENSECPLCRASLVCDDSQWVTLMKQMDVRPIYQKKLKFKIFFEQNQMNSSLSKLKQICSEFGKNESRIYFDKASNAVDLTVKEVYLKTAIKFNPNYFWAHYALGQLYAQKKLMQEATYHFTEALEIDSSAYFVYYELAHLFLQARCKRLPVYYFGKVVQIKFNHFNAHFYLGQLLGHPPFYQFERAIVHFKNALLIRPDSLEIHAKIADLAHFRLQNFTLAKYHYEKVIEFNPSFAILCKYAYLLSQMGHYQQSENYWLRAHRMRVGEKTDTIQQNLPLLVYTKHRIEVEKMRTRIAERNSWMQWKKEQDRKRQREM